MPRLTGAAAIGRLLAAHPRVKVIVLSVTSALVFVREMLAAGAQGYLTKSDAEELPRAIRAVASDSNYLSPEVAATAADPTGSGKPTDDCSRARVNSKTP